MILKDGGDGITVKSLKFWHDNKDKLGGVHSVVVDAEGLLIDEKVENSGTYSVEYNCLILGSEGAMYLSGCNCGYGGEGPNGTAKILSELGLPLEMARKVMLQKEIRYTVGIGVFGE